MDPDLGDHTAEIELRVARHLEASIFYVPRFALARVVANAVPSVSPRRDHRQVSPLW